MLGKLGQDYRGKTNGRFTLNLQTFSLISMNVKYGLYFYLFIFELCEYLRIHIRDGSRCSGTQMRVPHTAGCGVQAEVTGERSPAGGFFKNSRERIPVSGSFPTELLFRG